MRTAPKRPVHLSARRPRLRVAPSALAVALLAGGVLVVTPAAASSAEPSGRVATGEGGGGIEGGIEPWGLPRHHEAPTGDHSRASTAASASTARLPSYTVVDLGRGSTSNASDINEAGAVSGTLFDIAGEQPVVWQGEQLLRLDTGGAGQVRGMSIGDDGTVGGWDHSVPQGSEVQVHVAVPTVTLHR